MFAILLIPLGSYLYCYEGGTSGYLFSEVELVGRAAHPSGGKSFEIAKFHTIKDAKRMFTRDFWLDKGVGGAWISMNETSRRGNKTNICLYDENYSNYFKIVEID